MKTKLLLCTGYFLLSTSLLGQGINDGLMKQITRETCNELTNVDFSNKTPEELKVSLGLALVKVMGQHHSELKSFGVSIMDGKGVEKLATDIGMRLVTDCPAFVDALTRNPNTIKELAQTHSATGRISGKLIKIVGGEFTHLQVEDTKGKIEKLWWMEYFDGSNRLLIDPQNQLNKPVNVNYVEKEMYNSTLRDYVKLKVITSVE